MFTYAGRSREKQVPAYPFNPTTTIRYSLPYRSHVTLAVYNIIGQKVADLVPGDIDAGYQEVLFNPIGLASGVYFYRLEAGGFTAVKRLMVLK